MSSPWWFPAPISRSALSYDGQFARTLWVAGLIFCAAQIALVGIVWRFRKAQRANASDLAGNNRLEFLWTSATAVVFLGLLALGGYAWAGVQFTPTPPNSEMIEVLSKQFAWSFRYPGNDGVFGRTDPQQVNDATGNPFGIDVQDAAGKDDIVSATLRVPAGRPVRLILTSLDVIHSFFVRELRMKQDLVPNMRIPFQFTADVPGTFEVPCAELCGLGHAQMRTSLIVMPAAEFDRWKREQTH